MKDWTIKGLPPEVVEITRAAARRNGMMINAWVSRALAAAASDENATPAYAPQETLRDKYIMSALPAVIQHNGYFAGSLNLIRIIGDTYTIADAVMAERAAEHIIPPSIEWAVLAIDRGTLYPHFVILKNGKSSSGVFESFESAWQGMQELQAEEAQ